jgi:hypothetical protein
MPKNLLLLFLFTTFSFAQTKTITGVVSDTLNNPLESANIIALPKSEKGSFLVYFIKYKHSLVLNKS